MNPLRYLFVCGHQRWSCWACDSPIAHTPDQQWITLPTGSVYCSEDCCDEWEEQLAQDAAWLRCCAVCGFDQQEHDVGCTAVDPLGRTVRPT